MIVIDASVAAKWFLPEDGSAAAKDVLQRNDALIAPSLIRVEVAAAIMKASRAGKLSAATCSLLCEAWLTRAAQGIIRLEDTQEDYLHAARLAADLAHPYQDCLYLAVAQRLSVSLLSADLLQIRKAATAGIPSICL